MTTSQLLLDIMYENDEEIAKAIRVLNKSQKRLQEQIFLLRGQVIELETLKEERKYG